MNILTANLFFSTLVFWVAARIYILPNIARFGPRAVLVPILLLLHSFRHLGLMFLAPGAIYAGIPAQFAYPAAFGARLTGSLRSGSRRCWSRTTLPSSFSSGTGGTERIRHA